MTSFILHYYDSQHASDTMIVPKGPNKEEKWDTDDPTYWEETDETSQRDVINFNLWEV